MMSTVDHLRAYLEANIEVMRTTQAGPVLGYMCAADYVLDRGRVFESEPLTQKERYAVDKAVKRARCDFPTRECFSNAQRLVLEHAKLRYVEGYAVGWGSLPVHHAWASINGKVVDLTWRDQPLRDNPRLYAGQQPAAPSHRIVGRVPDGIVYMGVEFPARMLRERYERYEAWWSVLDGPDSADILRQPRLAHTSRKFS